MQPSSYIIISDITVTHNEAVYQLLKRGFLILGSHTATGNKVGIAIGLSKRLTVKLAFNRGFELRSLPKYSLSKQSMLLNDAINIILRNGAVIGATADKVWVGHNKEHLENISALSRKASPLLVKSLSGKLEAILSENSYIKWYSSAINAGKGNIGISSDPISGSSGCDSKIGTTSSCGISGRLESSSASGDINASGNLASTTVRLSPSTYDVGEIDHLTALLDSINGYYGSQVGMYFAFLYFYAQHLVAPAIVALLLSCHGLYVGRMLLSFGHCTGSSILPGSTSGAAVTGVGTTTVHLQRGVGGTSTTPTSSNSAFITTSDWLPLCAVLLVLWCSVFLALWRQRSAGLAYRWGLTAVEQRESDLGLIEVTHVGNLSPMCLSLYATPHQVYFR